MLERLIAILEEHQRDSSLFDKVVRGVFAYGSPQIQLIEEARLIATEGHRFDIRHDGESYIRHPELVAIIGMEYLGITDEIEICTDLLHDVTEDHEKEWPIYRLRERVGREIAEGVDWVNKRRFDHIANKREAHRAYYHNLMNVAPPRPVRTKLKDQLHNAITPWNLENEQWVASKVHDLREYHIPMAKKSVFLYQELNEAAEALEQGICLLPPLSKL